MANIVGTADNDKLTGTTDADKISGLAGNDTLSGAAGADTLDGGAGNDKMTGGAGSDLYHVDSSKDIVVEAANQGANGAVHSSIDYTLGANVETLLLIGAADLDGVGNSLNNFMFGNPGNNRLDGGAGNDLIEGGLGADTMDGGAGADIFVYDLENPADLANLGGDIINGFTRGQDKIDLRDLFADFNIDADDPFAGGFLKIETVGKDTIIRFDSDGGGDGFITLATGKNVINLAENDVITAAAV